MSNNMCLEETQACFYIYNDCDLCSDVKLLSFTLNSLSEEENVAKLDLWNNEFYFPRSLPKIVLTFNVYKHTRYGQFHKLYYS